MNTLTTTIGNTCGLILRKSATVVKDDATVVAKGVGGFFSGLYQGIKGNDLSVEEEAPVTAPVEEVVAPPTPPPTPTPTRKTNTRRK